MSEGVPMLYHGGNGFGGPRQGFGSGGPLERACHFPALEPPGPATPHHSERPAKDSTAFGYESDDSSLSSNASGSNKSGEKGESTSSASEPHSTPPLYAGREWRGRARRESHRPRRIAPERYLNASYPFQVKFTPDDLLNGSKWDNLSQEIWDKFVKSQQTEETFRKKMNLWRYLYVTIKSIFPRYGLYVVGSTMSGFALDSSDMDLCLYVRALGDADPRSHALLHLNYILAYIKSFDRDAELIQAKVPILKFRDARAGLQVDLNCNNVVGIRNTSLLYCYSRLDWRVRPLVAVTKLWAQAHDINDARHCTLSSYSLTLMVIHFLQCGTSPAVLPCVCVRGPWEVRAARHNRASLAELFLQLLRYYATFPYDKMAVSVRAGRCVPVAACRAARSHKNEPHQWKLLCVEEPFDLTNTARSVYDPETFERIVETFRSSHARLAASPRLAAAWPQHPQHGHHQHGPHQHGQHQHGQHQHGQHQYGQHQHGQHQHGQHAHQAPR